MKKWFPKAGEFPRKNALTPIGATAFGVFGASVAAASYLGETPMGWTILGVGSLPLVATVWGFWHFATNDPDRLQTEDYRLQHEVVARFPQLEGYPTSKIPPRDAELQSKTIEFHEGKESGH